MAAFANIALNKTQSIAVRCEDGKFSACPKGSKVPFFGCCNSEMDPCKQGCVGGNLQSTLFNARESHFTDQACDGEAGGLFYTCAAGQFVGCCTSNPCQSPFYCPTPNLRAATRITFGASDTAVSSSSSAAASKPPPTTENNVLAPGALAGIAIGGCTLLLALGLGIFLFLRRRKRAKQPSVSSGSPNPAEMRFEPLRTALPSSVETPRGSPSCFPVGTLYDAHGLTRSAAHTERDSRCAGSLGHPHDMNFELEDLAAPPRYESSHSHTFSGVNTPAIASRPDNVQLAAVIPELESRPVSTAISELESRPVSMDLPELASTSINDPTNTQSISSLSRIQFPFNIPPGGVQQRRDEGTEDVPRMRGSVAGPGWDDWNEQSGNINISRPPSAAYNPTQGPHILIPQHPQIAVPGSDHTLILSQQVPRPIKGEDEEKGP